MFRNQEIVFIIIFFSLYQLQYYLYTITHGLVTMILAFRLCRVDILLLFTYLEHLNKLSVV